MPQQSFSLHTNTRLCVCLHWPPNLCVQLGADFVHLWIGTQSSTVRSGVCGLGYVPTSPTNVPALLSTLNNICFNSFGLAHEVGHNQGCFHATGDVGTKGPAYAAGWRRCAIQAAHSIGRGAEVVQHTACGEGRRHSSAQHDAPGSCPDRPCL
jgi:hypothetical protein